VVVVRVVVVVVIMVYHQVVLEVSHFTNIAKP